MYSAEGLALTTADWLGVAATVVAIGGIVLSIFFYRRSLPKRAVAYSLRNSQSLETNAPYPGLHIEVTYLPEANFETDSASSVIQVVQAPALRRPHVWSFRIKNIGTRGLRAIDFENPISVKVDEGRIVSARIETVSTEGVHPRGELAAGAIDVNASQMISFRPRMMNPDDWLDISILTDGVSEAPSISSWIFEQTQPMTRMQWLGAGRDRPHWIVPVGSLLLTAGFVCFTAWAFFSDPNVYGVPSAQRSVASPFIFALVVAFIFGWMAVRFRRTVIRYIPYRANHDEVRMQRRH